MKNMSLDPIIFIKEVFGFLEDSSIQFHSHFKDLNTWNSLNALIIHHKIEQHYEVSLDYEIFHSLETIEELFHLVEKSIKHVS